MSNSLISIHRLLLLVVLGSFSPSVFAYLDPSTGSMILAAIVGVIATAGLALKTYWYKLKSFFSSSKSVIDSDSSSESDLTREDQSD